MRLADRGSNGVQSIPDTYPYNAAMRRYLTVATLLTALAMARETPQPKTFALACAVKDCQLLEGAPQTAGMKGGSVNLKPGDSIGWHSTTKRCKGPGHTGAAARSSAFG